MSTMSTSAVYANRNLHFSLEAVSARPMLDRAPNHLRMATCFMDLNWVYHLFVEYIDAAQGTEEPLGGEVHYFRSTDLDRWESADIAVPRGDVGDPDAFGASSPYVFATRETVYLFYAGHATAPGVTAAPDAERGERGFVTSRIMLTTAATDEHASPDESFAKQGVVLDVGTGWDSARVDDPCLLASGNRRRLYYTGTSSVRDLSKAAVGVADVELAISHCTAAPAPVLAVSGGGAMPRVFPYRDSLHMFYRLYHPQTGSIWQHFSSLDGNDWHLKNANLFAGAGSQPGKGAADIMLVHGLDGKLADPPLVLACGEEKGVLKLWCYKLVVKEAVV